MYTRLLILQGVVGSYQNLCSLQIPADFVIIPTSVVSQGLAISSSGSVSLYTTQCCDYNTVCVCVANRLIIRHEQQIYTGCRPKRQSLSKTRCSDCDNEAMVLIVHRSTSIEMVLSNFSGYGINSTSVCNTDYLMHASLRALNTPSSRITL